MTRQRTRQRRLLVENLEDRRLLAVLGVPRSSGPSLTDQGLATVAQTGVFANATTALQVQQQFREQGTSGGLTTIPPVQQPGIQQGLVTVQEQEPNNTIRDAQPLNLGTAPGKQWSIDVAASLPLNTGGPPDVDFFKFELRAGDILNARVVSQTNGGSHSLSLYQLNASETSGVEIAGNDRPLMPPLWGSFPVDSPLLADGQASVATVIPEDGTYAVRVGAFWVDSIGGAYTLNLRAHRPALESQPIGSHQILYLDFDGEIVDLSDVFGPMFASHRMQAMNRALPGIGLPMGAENALIDQIVEQTIGAFNRLGVTANNGFYEQTGTPGDFQLTVLNSRDHEDPWGLPNVSRVVVGGSGIDMDDIGLDGLLGIAESVDIGNFALEETAFVFVDQFDYFTNLVLDDDIALAGDVSLREFLGRMLADTVIHEAGHFFGASHVTALDDYMAPFADAEYLSGPDLIFGTDDDPVISFGSSFFFTGRSLIDYGVHDVANSLAFGLSSGTIGGSITGRVFADVNRDGKRDSNEPGIGGVTIFADLNNNGVLDPGEPRTVTRADGTYTLGAAAGSVTVRMITPEGFLTTTPTSRTVTVSNNATRSGVDFGLDAAAIQVTGYKWLDLDGDGVRDPGEPGIPGVFIYADLNGDGKINLNEPRAVTDENGFYRLTLPGPGTYTIREVKEPGLVQTFPEQGFHTVTFSGGPITQLYNFGNTIQVDSGTAPPPYPDAEHGIVPGLHLGAQNGVDDGVLVTSPLVRGTSNNTVQVTAVNTTGQPAYLNAWVDFNQDGDWNDPGEQIFTNRLIGTGTHTLSFTIPANARLGETAARFRYSHTQNLGPSGFAATGEVEDYVFLIRDTAALASDDHFAVERNSVSNVLDVLANDFDTAADPLTITSVNTAETAGVVIVSGNGRSILYTPQTNFVGQDSFRYTVRNASGQTSTARVTIDVQFQSTVPIAIDDSFNIDEGSTGVPLDVLANDIPSTAGGLQIIATSTPRAAIATGGTHLLYTPPTAASFNGTEQFTYTVSDVDGNTSQATVTVHVLPLARQNDLVNMQLQLLDEHGQSAVSKVQVGDTFQVRVLVDDLRTLSIADSPGIASAYLDLLYSEDFVSTIPSSGPGAAFPFQITFGPLFTAAQTGDADLPGLLNEVGARQTSPRTPHTGPVELFTVTMVATGAGTARFTADPADDSFSSVALVNAPNTSLTPGQIRFGRAELAVLPAEEPFFFAVDDSFPTGVDSLGATIEPGSGAILDVLRNDNRGLAGTATIVDISTPGNGTAVLGGGGNIVYTPAAGFAGTDQFTYTIASPDGQQSTATVTVRVPGAEANDRVEFDFTILNAAGNPTSSVQVGETFRLQITVQDVRTPSVAFDSGIFAAYLDVLYDAGLVRPANTTGSDFGIDVVFGPGFNRDVASGDAIVPGLIDEFGTVAQGTNPQGNSPLLLATLSFVATASGTARFVGDPADLSPFQDTLLFDPPNAVPIERIRYDLASVTITGGSGEGELPFHNALNPYDVNNDGSVSPIDALTVINALNRHGSQSLVAEAEGGSGGTAVTMFYDVNGDNKLTPIDALMIINHLNRRVSSPSGEGEAVAANLAPPIDAPGASEEEVLAEAIAAVDLSAEGEGDSPVTTAVNGSATPPSYDQLGGNSSSSASDDEDEDELLGLLAEDIAPLWS